MSYNLDGYVDVATRMGEFFTTYPTGSITHDPARIVTIDQHTFIGVMAYAYRTPDDTRPAVGEAWEPFPGKTPYTRDSEMMNAATSATGRALAALGIGLSKSVASADEVRNRQTERTDAAPLKTSGYNSGVPASDSQRRMIFAKLKGSGMVQGMWPEFLSTATGRDVAGIDDLLKGDIDTVVQAIDGFKAVDDMWAGE